MKDYRVEVRVKNNLLYNAIMSEYESVAAFSRVAHINPVGISDLINTLLRLRGCNIKSF